MPTRHKNERALLRSGQEASEPAAYFYTCIISALDSARLLFWSGQCLELPLILKRLGEKGRGLLQLDTTTVETLTQISQKCLLPDHVRIENSTIFKFMLVYAQTTIKHKEKTRSETGLLFYVDLFLKGLYYV